MTPVKPPPLSQGDTVAIVAPAGPVERAAFQSGLTWLQRHFKPLWSEAILSRSGFLAGSDERRRHELQAAIDRADTRAVVSARGGFGTTRILDRLELDNLAEAPKWIVGSSDLTALLVQVWAKHRLVTIHGPMIAGFEIGRLSDYETLVDLLQGRQWVPPPELSPLFKGTAQGPLVGGNLTVLAHLCGAVSPAFTQGAVLFLEDVAEQPYRLDRCMTQLLRAGFLDQVAGVVLGRFTDCAAGADGTTVQQVMAESLQPLGIPVAVDYPAAHGGVNYPFVHGASVALEVTADAAYLRTL